MSFTYWLGGGGGGGGGPHLTAGAGRRSLLELPLLPAHGAVLLHLLRIEPLQDAVHVEAVRALAPHQRAVVAGHLACRGQGQGQGHGGLTDSPGLAQPRLRKASGGWGEAGAAQGAQWQGQCACLRLGHVTCDAKKAALSLSRCGAC